MEEREEGILLQPLALSLHFGRQRTTSELVGPSTSPCVPRLRLERGPCAGGASSPRQEPASMPTMGGGWVPSPEGPCLQFPCLLGPALQRPARPVGGASPDRRPARCTLGAVGAAGLARCAPGAVGACRVILLSHRGGGVAAVRVRSSLPPGSGVSSRRDGREAAADRPAGEDGGAGGRPRGNGERLGPAVLLPPGHGGLPIRAEPRLPPAP